MNNQHPTKDKIKAPHICKDVNKIVQKMQHLRALFEQMEGAYEGYLLCFSYGEAEISSKYHKEAANNQKLYQMFFGDAFEELEEIWYDMLQMHREEQ